MLKEIQDLEKEKEKLSLKIRGIEGKIKLIQANCNHINTIEKSCKWGDGTIYNTYCKDCGKRVKSYIV